MAKFSTPIMVGNKPYGNSPLRYHDANWHWCYSDTTTCNSEIGVPHYSYEQKSIAAHLFVECECRNRNLPECYCWAITETSECVRNYYETQIGEDGFGNCQSRIVHGYYRHIARLPTSRHCFLPFLHGLFCLAFRTPTYLGWKARNRRIRTQASARYCASVSFWIEIRHYPVRLIRSHEPIPLAI